MARTKATPTVSIATPENPIVTAEIHQEVQTRAELEMQDHFQAGVAIGRLEAFKFISDVGNSAALITYENIKKTKGWSFARSCDGRNFENFDDFCRARFGRSYNRMQELLANRNLLGEEMFEQAENLGLRQIDYNAIKALPAPRQEIVKEALADGATLDDVKQCIQQLAADTQHEIEALKAEVAEVKADADAKDRVLSDKNKKIDELTLKTVRLAETDWPEAFRGYIAQVGQCREDIERGLVGIDAIRINAMGCPQSPEEAESPMFRAALKALCTAMTETLQRAEDVLGGLRSIHDRTIVAICEE